MTRRSIGLLQLSISPGKRYSRSTYDQVMPMVLNFYHTVYQVRTRMPAQGRLSRSHRAKYDALA